MNSFGLRFCYFASSFQRLYCLSVEQRYENFPFLQKFSREYWLVMGLCPLVSPLCFFRGMPKGVGEPGGFFMGLCPLIPLVCYFSLLRQRKVTKRKASPARTAVLSGRHVDAGFGAWPPPTLRIGQPPTERVLRMKGTLYEPDLRRSNCCMCLHGRFLCP